MPTTTAPPRTLILVAAELEADILFGPAGSRASWLDICVAGVGRSGDAAAGQAIDATGADLVVNPGFAGGLSERARPGRCFTVTEWASTEAPDEQRELPQGLLDVLAPLSFQPGIATTVDQPVGDAESRQLLAATGTDLVEMEGSRWAAEAFQRGLPFVSLRVISDCADNALPRPRHELLSAAGGVHWTRWLRAVAASDRGWRESVARLRRARSDWHLACNSLRTVGAALAAWQRPATGP